MSKPTIPTDSPSIFAQLTELDRKAIVRPNNPPPGIAGFLFSLDQDEVIELTSEITDNVLEDNTAVADGIGLLPERVTVRGVIAELTDSGRLPEAAARVPQPLPLFPPLFPRFSPGAVLNFGAAFGSLGSAVSGAVSSVRKATGVDLRPSIDILSTVRGHLGPFSATAIVAAVNGQLGGVVNVSTDVRGAVAQAVNGAVKSLGVRNAPVVGAITSAINSAVGNVLGSALTPKIAALVGQSVNATVATVAGATPGPGADQAPSAYRYYLNRAPVTDAKSRQAAALGFFYQCWRGRLLFSVETPWGFLENMAIQTVRAEQPEESRDATNFTVVFKKVRIAGQTTVNLGELAGRNAFQAAADAPAQNGVAGQTTATPAQEESWLAAIIGR